MNKNILFSMLAILAIISLPGCSNSSESPSAGYISLSSKYQSTSLNKLAGVDSVRITKATLLLREIKFKTQGDSTDGLYKTTPLILELNLNGSVQTIQGLSVPFGTYNRLEFDIHKAEASDTTAMPADQKVKMRVFFSGTEKYSIIIQGMTYTGGMASNFTYKSSLNVKQKIDLSNPLVITESQPDFNVTMLINSFGWFLNNTALLEPSNSANITKINDNIRQSIRAIRDKNKDGIAE